MQVAVIPARGGSKRIPRKNIKSFCGKPIIAWPIETAIESGLFDRILVSTDDQEIADVAQAFGAEVPFMRPAKLANDYAVTTEVIGHSISWMQSQNWKLDAVCCIYPTAATVQKVDLQRGLEGLRSGTWAYAFSVTEYAFPIFRAIKENIDGGVEMYFSECSLKRSQDITTALHDAGQFYWGKPEAWCNNQKIFDKHSMPIHIPRWCVQDIDTNEDWIGAELSFKMINQKSKHKMEDKNKQIKHYLKVIDEIEIVRTKNNINWMDILRLAFTYAPEEAKKLMKKIDLEDNRISELVKELSG